MHIFKIDAVARNSTKGVLPCLAKLQAPFDPLLEGNRFQFRILECTTKPFRSNLRRGRQYDSAERTMLTPSLVDRFKGDRIVRKFEFHNVANGNLPTCLAHRSERHTEGEECTDFTGLIEL